MAAACTAASVSIADADYGRPLEVALPGWLAGRPLTLSPMTRRRRATVCCVIS